MLAACGEPIDVPEKRERVERKPKEHCGEYRDMEYEDPETGLWWQEMDCVDCYRVFNEEIRRWRRQRLEYTLMWLAARPESIEDAEVDSVLEYLERLKSGAEGTG